MLKKNDTIQPTQDAEMRPVLRSHNTAKVPAPLLFLGGIARGALQIILMGAIVLGGLEGMNRLISAADEPPKRPVFKTVYTVDTVVSTPGDFQPTLTVYGEVVAARKVDLRSLVSGEVTSVNPALKVGAAVKKDDPILEVDRFNYEAGLSEAKANLAETNARIAEYRARIRNEETKIKAQRDQLVLAKTDLERIQSLRENGTAAQKNVDDRFLTLSQRELSVSQTEINIEAENARLTQQLAVKERLEWRVRQAERNLEDTVLNVPFSGIISATQVEVGKMIGANDVVVSLYDADRLDVRFTLTDQRFGRIQSDPAGVVGRKVEVIWSVGGEQFKFPATIERIGAQIASSRGGVEVFALIEDVPDGISIRPGAFVEVRVPDKLYAAHHRLPEASVYGGELAYVVIDGKLVERKVKISSYDGDFVLVSDGINAGDEVLVTRIAEISEGLSVRTEEQAKAASRIPSGMETFRNLPASEKQKIVAGIIKENSLTMDQWQAMPRPEKGPLIGKYLKDNPVGEKK